MRPLPFLLLAACSNQLALQDQYDNGVNPLFSGPEDELASPYQVGVTFDIELVGRDATVVISELVSSDDAVLTVVQMRTETDDESNAQRRFAQVRTVGVGTADLVIQQDGRDRHTATVEVLSPDRIAFAPVQRLVALQGDEAVDDGVFVDRLDVLVGSEAEFELRPMAGEELLTGAALPALDLPNGSAEAGGYRTDNEFDVVLLSPADGAATLTLTYPGQTFTADVHGHTTVGALELDCIDDEAQADEFGGFACMATAETTGGQPLFGVFPSWLVVLEDGSTTPLETIATTGDVLTYQVGEGLGPGPELQVVYEDKTHTQTAFGPLGSAELQNSNDMTACSAISPWSLWLAAPAMLLLGLRRRRE